MLYHLFEYLNKIDFPGAGVFQYISFRAMFSVIISLFISLIFGKKIIKYLHEKQIGETVRNLGLEGQKEKQGTPTMGGIIIISAILIPTLLLANLTNIYIQLLILTTLWLGSIGFADDYIKVFKKNKKGLAGKYKIAGQILLGLIIGIVMSTHKDIKIQEKKSYEEIQEQKVDINKPLSASVYFKEAQKSTKTTIPFIKNNEFDYAWIIEWINKDLINYSWLFLIPIIILIITSVSNGANLTDGIDGLATGTSAIVGTTLAIFAYVSGNFIFANYLHIMFIPNTGELVIFIAAFVGACIGFLWYNSFPAQIFMGDTGSLTLGGIIAVYAIVIRKELLIPIFCGIFFIESLSVVLQVGYYKYTKKKYGEGRRIFLMSPLHHHYQKKGIHESKIVARFWIIGIILAILSIVTLKLR